MWSGTVRRGALIEAARSLGIPGFDPPELRHTAASLAITSGADIKVVQQMMGHKSATMTLDRTGTCSRIGWMWSPMLWMPRGRRR